MAEDGDGQKELQLLPSPPVRKQKPTMITAEHRSVAVIQQDLDLKLSISIGPISAAAENPYGSSGGVEALKWQAAEQIRLAATEKAYAERVRELTRREMEIARSEFARAGHIWQRAREEVEKAERLMERARKIDPTCMEIICHSCRQSFRP